MRERTLPAFEELDHKIFFPLRNGDGITTFQYQGSAIGFAVVDPDLGGIDEAGMMRTDKTGRRQQLFVTAKVTRHKDGFAVTDVELGV